MKVIALVIIISLSLLSISCCCDDNPRPFDSQGLITSFDVRKCASPLCGGWFIEIEENQYRFFDLPLNSGIDLNKSFSDENYLPLKVQLDWKKDTTLEPIDLIIISRIEEL